MLEKALVQGACISVITRLELISWYNLTEVSLRAITILLNNVTEQSLTEEIIQSSAHLRRTFRLKLPDAIIAATALHHEVPLITRNVSDFKNVKGLKLINPFD